MGRKLHQESFGLLDKEIVNISSLSGIFIVRLTSSGEVVTQKFLK